jgi:hypothetical protein
MMRTKTSATRSQSSPAETPDEAFKRTVSAITDPAEFLRVLVENESFLGYDPYYADLRDVLMVKAEQLAGPAPTID